MTTSVATAFETILPEALREQAGQITLIDVRTPAEFAQVHAAGARNVPLDRLDADALLRESKPDETIYVICKAGGRGAKACKALVEACTTRVEACTTRVETRGADSPRIVNVAGGTDAWVAMGLPVVRGTSKVISLERQVRIVAGTLVLIGVALGWLVHPAFFGLSAFVGAGLVFAGVTDFCGMGMLLARMPWNQMR